MLISKIRICLMGLGLVTLSLNASAALETMATGKLSELKRDSFKLQMGNETREFSRHSVKIPGGVRVGDELTVWYKMEATRVQPVTTHQQPGQAAPRDTAPGKRPQSPGMKDDRIFYPG